MPKPPVPDDLSNAEKRQLMRWVKKQFPEWYTPKRLRWVVGETLDYWGARDNPHGYKNWIRVVQNRIRQLDALDIDPFEKRKTYREREYPQEPRPKEERQPELLANVVNIGSWVKR